MGLRLFTAAGPGCTLDAIDCATHYLSSHQNDKKSKIQKIQFFSDSEYGSYFLYFHDSGWVDKCKCQSGLRWNLDLSMIILCYYDSD